MQVAASNGRRVPLTSILITLLLVGLLAIASGCCGPRGCSSTGCGPNGCPVTMACPPHHVDVYAHHGGHPVHGIPHHFTHPPHKYAEPQWPYYDQSGTPRIMGDTRLRSHLGVAAEPGPVAE